MPGGERLPEWSRKIFPQKALVYLVDNGTSGPISRAAKISSALAAKGVEVSILTPKNLMDSPLLPDGMQKIPYALAQMWRPSRLNPQYKIFKIKPDILVVDEYPFVAHEHVHAWEPIIATAKRANRACQIHGMSCDIPIYDRDAESKYLAKRSRRMHHIWVTGDPSITRIDDFIKGDAATHVAGKIDYVGFMETPHEQSASDHKSKEDTILAYLGGQNAMALANRYVSLIANIPYLSASMSHARWRIILPEPFDMTGRTRIETALSAIPEDVSARISVEPSDRNFKTKLDRASMVVTGGGQTAIESTLIAAKPTVILPGFFGEQFVRAKDFAEKFPQRVVARDLPTYRVRAMTTQRLRQNLIRGVVEPDWMTQTLRWAESDAACTQLREGLEQVYASQHLTYPKPQIMLNGAQRMADNITNSRSR